jgi:TIR domain/Pentapeptide repeats (8 copies)
MANEEHLARLKQGVEAWNQWRDEHPEIFPDFRGADLHGAHLTGAYLAGADLRWVDLTGVDPTGADLTKAFIGWTRFADVDLSTARGLETVQHWGPSTIGIDTLYRSKGNIPEVFLRGAGVPDEMIAYMKSLVGRPFEFYSCFISYSSKDQEFAERLYADLQNKGVRCWFAPEDLKIGEKFRTSIDEAIRLRDKLLLVLSTHSMTSEWVETEVETAFEEEHRRKKTILFPIRLDDSVMETHQAWATSIRRTRHIGDFHQWKDHDTYQQAFQRLLRDLKANI